MMKTSLIALGSLAVLAAPALAEKRVAKPKLTLPAPAAPVVKKAVPAVASANVAANELATLDLANAPVELGDLTGGDFDVFTHKHEVAHAGDAEPVLKLKGGDEKQQSAVAKTRIADIEYCWDKLPQARRATATSAVLKLAIEPIGAVAATEVTGDALHPEFKKCVVDMTSRWRFPVTDNATEIEFAVSLASIKVAH